MSDGPDRAAARLVSTRRLEAFSDGVFAIAVTLFVLELSVPPGSNDDLLAAILALWPAYLAYVVSFATIGLAWLLHTTITGYVDRADSIFMRLTLLLLLVVAFLPFPTRLVGESINIEDAERVAVTLLGLNLLLMALVIELIWRYAVITRLIRADADDGEIRVLSRRLTPGLGGYVVLILVGLFLPVLAVVGYLAIAIGLLLPFGIGFSVRASRRP